jgi:hypothetical protein
VERSGRSLSNAMSRSSGQPRSWSASERFPLVAVRVTGRGVDEVAIVPTLAGGSITGPRSDLDSASGREGR